MVAQLGYWKLRGLGQAIRLLLEYSGEPYEEKIYDDHKEADVEAWQRDKPNLDTDFPNLPFYFDGDVKLTQSNAILRYIARKKNLAGQSEEEYRAIDLIENLIGDIRQKFGDLVYGSSNFEKDRSEYETWVNNSFGQLSKYLGEKKFAAGDNITYIDFNLYEVFDINNEMFPGLVAKFPNIKAYHQRIEALPAIATYMKSDKYIKYPINGSMAHFGGNKQ